jgi:hypothetical protein
MPPRTGRLGARIAVGLDVVTASVHAFAGSEWRW